ncbi:crotonobetainyl-CoA:carnitine CoA-transferase CaiB-like acyl-CoA transferase [Paraburkholderia eburnea]|uniref:Crotonobetainyl-CoA:carnitine CoA-transferase CaiB-like acyl-CoA transferase n=1 Tax=Paraburkholderia eburnea TaxID=1189126 RepID=A0A2S4MG41_9BURK|nr:crotonobetainyl-CoA:carnitine CoA-transferase CaiB-like acyl-CoA transferase [Paraburkholderia eburnea]PRZ25672.1 crotonobetainyl-CoA:carnitine CoA-transferase CaiB-like acyl-CoA transferase [Paraburkholderia eburnea]
MSTPAALQGLRVLDLTRLLPGPVATLRLAEMGADVLKIEPPGAGDAARTMMQNTTDELAGRPGAFYRLVNRGKRETRLDLKSEGGRAVLLALARDADVLVESFRPGVMERLGVGYETLRAANPKLVYCAITGYGSTGPFSDRAGHDLNYVAYAGVLDQLATRDGAPVLPNFQIADLLGGALSAVTQILAALWHVSRGGEGRFVDISMARESHVNNVVAQVALANDDAAALQPGGGLLNGGVPCYNLYRTQDDRWLAVGALELKFWQALCAALGREDWAQRHWSLGQAIGGSDAASLTRELGALIASETLQTWIDRLEVIDCCVSPVLTPGEAANHPLFNADVLRAMLDDIDAQREAAVQPPASIARLPMGAAPAAPAISPASAHPSAGQPGKKPFNYGPWG